jgi:hypothetical protein
MREGHYWLRARLHDRVPIKPAGAIEIVMKNQPETTPQCGRSTSDKKGAPLSRRAL